MDDRIRLPHRMRRNRRTEAVRSLVRETNVTAADLIWPLFVVAGEEQRIPIASMPRVQRLSIDVLVDEARAAHELGICAVALFPVIKDSLKDPTAAESANKDGLYAHAIRELKEAVPGLAVISDVAMDPYSSDGHDGLVHHGRILNDETLEILATMAICHAEAGADIVAPSDMMDGRVAAIRDALDEEALDQTPILSYAAKYASAFYGPFRDAAESTPASGDRRGYQMDPANEREAMREIASDLEEGADMVMVKPAMPYLDVIRAAREFVDVPLFAYQVSGEYSMLRAAMERGWLDEQRGMDESLLAIRRAGADRILTYFAKDFARRVRS